MVRRVFPERWPTRMDIEAKKREAAAKGDLRLDLYFEPKSRTLNRVRLATASAAK